MTNDIFNTSETRQGNFFLIAGPCVVENSDMPLEIAAYVKNITDKLGINYIFKSSYKKANRTRSDSFMGIGDNKALEVLGSIKKELCVDVLTDIHSESEAALAAIYVDILQIPAFLCRQTELIIAAANTGKAVNIKKGQFMSADAMKFAVDKVMQCGNSKVMLTERGSMFGYHDLVVDFRNIYTMNKFGVPVVLDVTHSLQQPNHSSGVSGGNPEMIETIAKAGIAAGVDGIFLETHPNPAVAKSDGSNMLKLDLLETLLVKLTKLRAAL